MNEEKKKKPANETINLHNPYIFSTLWYKPIFNVHFYNERLQNQYETTEARKDQLSFIIIFVCYIKFAVRLTGVYYVQFIL